LIKKERRIFFVEEFFRWRRKN